MALENGKWRVVKGDCLWNIAKSVYSNAYRWTDIANANGIKQSSPIIYPGQLLTLPNISSSSSSSSSTTSSSATKVTMSWFALDAGTTRSMFATWSFTRDDTDHFEIEWAYDTGAGGWRIGQTGTVTYDAKQTSYTAPDNAKKVRLRVKPIATSSTSDGTTTYAWTNGEWVSSEYNFSNNPPDLPPDPTFSIDSKNVLTIECSNIDEDINATAIEFAIYQDDTYKYNTGTATINFDARYCKYTCTVESGHTYKVRCRGVRDSIYGGWTDFTDNESSNPIAPTEITALRSTVISEQMSKQYAVDIQWSAVDTATSYIVQWVTNIELWDTSQMSSQQTDEDQGTRLLLTDLELGHEYFFRVKSVNDKGTSTDATPVKSVTLGIKPSAPTTYSNVSNCVVGEDLNLYWVHNSQDGSIETQARLYLNITDSAHPEIPATEIYKIIKNEKPDDEKDQTSVYTINTDDPDWATIGEGYIIKWKVQTCGITSEYSDWSIEREVNVYAKPEVSIDIQNLEGQSVEEISKFPFYISVTATPAAQTPISYYVEVVANDAYESADDTGEVKMVNIGDKVYQKYYDPQQNPWRFLVEMTPANIDLENEVSYTINVTVSMNSGLNATSSFPFTVYFNDYFYDVYADITINQETLEANIHPYCYEYQDNEPVLIEGCSLSVYRKEYDGTFTEIATGINNEPNLWVTDPHPSLDYARYRIVAKTDDTGAISFGDIPGIKVGDPNVVLQWAEKWSTFQTAEDGEGLVEPAWAGSMIKIPYNISVSDSKNIDVSLVEYVGRKHPVSYYGTHLGETSSWSVEIPKEDKELLYALRRLAIYTGDVYVREPSGTGYWANITVSYSLKYSDVTVPVTFGITRVEGGM